MTGSPLKRARREAQAAERARLLVLGAWEPAPVPAHIQRTPPKDLSFREFRLRYFGMESYPHHLQVIDAIDKAKRMEVSLVLIFPNSGKTTLLEDYICFRVARDPDIRIQVVSEAQEHAEKIVGRVKNRMTDPDFAEFQKDWGPFHVQGSERTWAAYKIRVDKAQNDERDFTLQCRGWTSAVAGTRTDLMLVDDIQSTKNLSQTDAMVRKFRQDFLTRPGRQSRVVIVGTRVDWDDFYDRILAAGIVDPAHVVNLPATSHGCTVPCDLPAEEGPCKVPEIPHEVSLCPEMWPSHDLAVMRRQVGDAVWWRNYQQEPKRAGDGSFTPEMWAAACDRSRKVEPLSGPLVGPGQVAFGLDPGMGRTGHTSVVAARMGSHRLDLLDMEDVSGFTRLEQIPELVASLAPLYRPSLLIVETDAMQAGIARMDPMRELSQQYGFSIYEHRSSGEKADATLGLMAMAGSFNAGQISVPAGDEFSVRRFEVLHDQLLGWRHDVGKNYRCDSAMALWFVWKYWSEMRQGWIDGGSDWSFRGMPRGLRPTTTAEVLRR